MVKRPQGSPYPHVPPILMSASFELQAPRIDLSRVSTLDPRVFSHPAHHTLPPTPSQSREGTPSLGSGADHHAGPSASSLSNAPSRLKGKAPPAVPPRYDKETTQKRKRTRFVLGEGEVEMDDLRDPENNGM